MRTTGTASTTDIANLPLLRSSPLLRHTAMSTLPSSNKMDKAREVVEIVKGLPADDQSAAFVYGEHSQRDESIVIIKCMSWALISSLV
jgi:hypothetical protein